MILKEPRMGNKPGRRPGQCKPADTAKAGGKEGTLVLGHHFDLGGGVRRLSDNAERQHEDQGHFLFSRAGSPDGRRSFGIQGDPGTRQDRGRRSRTVRLWRCGTAGPGGPLLEVPPAVPNGTELVARPVFVDGGLEIAREAQKRGLGLDFLLLFTAMCGERELREELRLPFHSF